MDKLDRETHFPKKFASMKCQRVKVDDSFAPALEDEAVEVQHLLAEPKTNHVSVDGVLCLGKEKSSKCSETNGFSFGFNDGMRRNIGGLHSHITQGPDDLDLGVLDGFLDEVDEVDDIHAANDFSGAYEDFILDIELAQKVSYLDYTPRDGSRLRNSSSESQSPGCSGSSNGAAGMSELSTATIPESESKNGWHNKTVKCKLRRSSGDKWNSQEPGEDSACPTSDDIEDLDELDDDAKPLISLVSGKNAKKVVHAAKAGTSARQKRLRKPTKRYIEELSDPKSKQVMERKSDLSATLKDKRPKIRSHDELHCGSALARTPKDSFSENFNQAIPKGTDEPLHLRSKPVSERRTNPSFISKGRCWSVTSQNEPCQVRAAKFAPKELSLTGPSAQAPFESRPRRGRPKKSLPLSFLESEDDESEDDCVKKRICKKSNDRRKHQRMWTTPEVMKLIDGIAQYGTGRWTDIKKLMFSSTAYRTPIDLRDKWRNLLRASGAQKRKSNKKEDKEKLKDVVRSLPSSVFRRVRELASLHPYPSILDNLSCGVDNPVIHCTNSTDLTGACDRERFCSVQGACERQNGRKKCESPAGSSRENKVVRATSGCVVFCPQFENNLVEPGSGSGVATGSLISWKSVADGAGGACVTSSKPPVTPGSKVKTALGPAIRLIKIPKPRFLRESEAIGLMK
ncbi:TRF-LIKE 8 [Salix viminalis]|uniref:TRF-LIKE 8 n=1 Tax=Salix viminalis TaxID=40686 RepID=A0A9Q0V667_SALVM|nr:TRF-LIKE 8 [Salix viminalis]